VSQVATSSKLMNIYWHRQLTSEESSPSYIIDLIMIYKPVEQIGSLTVGTGITQARTSRHNYCIAIFVKEVVLNWSSGVSKTIMFDHMLGQKTKYWDRCQQRDISCSCVSQVYWLHRVWLLPLRLYVIITLIDSKLIFVTTANLSDKY